MSPNEAAPEPEANSEDSEEEEEVPENGAEEVNGGMSNCF